MNETNKENPMLKLEENSFEKSKFIHDHIKETEINKYDIEKPNLNNKINLMNSMMSKMGMDNQMDSMMMNNEMMNQMGMNNQMDSMMMNNPMMNQMGMNNQMDSMAANQMSMQIVNHYELENKKMMNCQNNNQSSDKEKIEDKQNQSIPLCFQRSNKLRNRTSIIILSSPNEKVSDIIQKYRAKADDRDSTKKFIFNAKNLNKDLSVAEAGLYNNAHIFVVYTKVTKGGGCPMMFTDLSKKKQKK